MKIKEKLLLSFLLICSVTLSIISVSAYIVAKNTLTRQVLNQLQSVSEIQKNRVEDIIDQSLKRLVLVSSRTQLRLSLEKFIEDRKIERQVKMNRILRDARSSIKDFQQISVLTLDGKVVGSTNPENIGTRHSDKEFFIRGQKENCTDIFYLDDDQNLMAHLSGPLHLDGKLLGVVAIEADTDNIISLIKDYSGLGETGEISLARRDENGNAQFITPMRFDKHAALRRVVSKNDLSAPVTQSLLKKEKLFHDTVDYRSQPVLAATRYIEKPGWGLVVKVDTTEVFAPISRLRNLMAIIICVSTILALIISYYLAKSITRPIIHLTREAGKISEGDLSARAKLESTDEIRDLGQAFNQMAEALETDIAERKQAESELRDSEKRYYALFEEAPVMYLTVRDEEGIPVISDCNAAFLTTLGYTRDEVLEQPLAKFYTPESQEALFEGGGFQKALRGKMKIPVERNFVARDGRIIPTLLRTGPEIDEKGKLIGTRAMFTDITERKQAEEELQEYRENLEEMVKERTAELQKTINLLTGREVRMAELKRVIEKLRAQLEEAGMTPVADDPLKEMGSP